MNAKRKRQNKLFTAILILAVAVSCAGCGEFVRIPLLIDSLKTTEIIVVPDETETTPEAVKGRRDNTPRVLLHADPEPTAVQAAKNLWMDTAHISDGYVQVSYRGSNSKPVIRITAPDGTKYQYDLPKDHSYCAYPLNCGDGTYSIAVYEHYQGESYTALYKTKLEVRLRDALLPFLYSNPYCDFSEASEVVGAAMDAAWSANDDLDVIRNVFNYVTKNITYDYDKAATVETGYVPDVDTVLREKKGICLDYAALMTAMLRSQGIPARIEIGYRDQEFHAWVSVYEPQKGWLNAIISLGDKEWTMLDPTSAAAWGNNLEGLSQKHEYVMAYYY